MSDEDEQKLNISFTEKELQKLGLKKRNSCYIITQVDSKNQEKSENKM